MTAIPDSIDLRPFLAQGTDPLAMVVEAAKRLGPGGCWVLEAPFNPLPLRRVLAAMGLSSTATRLGDQHWRVALIQDGAGTITEHSPSDACPGLTEIGAPLWREADGLHVDVRGLTAPLPMLAILRLVSGIDADETVAVHHDRDPIYLVPELAEIGWSLEPLGGQPGDLRFLVRRIG